MMYICDICGIQSANPTSVTVDCEGDEQHQWSKLGESEDDDQFSDSFSHSEENNYVCVWCDATTFDLGNFEEECLADSEHKWEIAMADDSSGDEFDQVDDDFIQPLMRRQANQINVNECWFGVSEIFKTDKIYCVQNVNDPYHARRISLIGKALEIEPVGVKYDGGTFIRDAFSIISFWDLTENKFAEGLIVYGSDDFIEAAEVTNFELTDISETVRHLGGANSQGGNVTFAPPTNKCPFGAVVVGLGRCFPLRLSAYEMAAQPIIPIRCANGHVNHTDEFVGFIGTPQNWKMVLPSADLGLELLDRLNKLRNNFPTEQIIPGCLGFKPQSIGLPRAISLTQEGGTAQVFIETRRELQESLGLDHQFNQSHLVSEIGIDINHVLIIPNLRSPLIPTSVNMVSCNGKVVVPRPHSFRVTIEEARKIFLDLPETPKLPLELLESDEFIEFVKNSTFVEFMVDENMTCLNVAASFTPNTPARKETAEKIALFNRIDKIDQSIEDIFVKIPCPENTFDLFEGFIFLQFLKYQIPVVFIPSADLHRGMGNVHCATNYRPNFLDFVDFLGLDHQALKTNMLQSCLEHNAESEIKQRVSEVDD